MKKLIQFVFVTIITLSPACRKDNSTVIPMEEVAGYTFYYDLNGIKSADNSGISVSLEGYPVLTTTKSNGHWIFSHLESGTYTFVFSKPGYGTMKITEKRLVGGYSFIDTVSLYPVPLYNTALAKASVNPGNTVLIDGYFTGTLPDCPCCHLFFGKTSNVSSETGKYIQDLAIFAPGSEEGEPNGFETVFTNQILKDKGFKSGDIVYVTAYPDYSVAITYNSWDVAYYYEPGTGTKVFPNLGPNKSNTLSFVLP